MSLSFEVKRYIRGKNFPVLDPKIPKYVTFDVNNCISKLRLSKATFRSLNVVTKYLIGKNICLKVFKQLCSLFKGQPFLLDTKREVLKFQTIFVQ